MIVCQQEDRSIRLALKKRIKGGTFCSVMGQLHRSIGYRLILQCHGLCRKPDSGTRRFIRHDLQA